jgi:hypothetical protein
MEVKVTVDGNSIRTALKELEAIAPGLKKDMANSLKSQLESVASDIAGSVPGASPLSGMNARGRLRWAKIRKPTVSITPGRSKRGQSFVSIKVGANPEAGLLMAELAGSKNRAGGWKPEVASYSRSGGGTVKGYRNTGKQGEALIHALNARYPMKGKAGRFLYNKFRQLRPEIVFKATNIANKYLELVNRKLE